MNRTAIIVLLALAGSGTTFAQDDATSLSYVSYLERYATIRSGQADETLDVVVNMPVLAGDRLDSSRGARVEVQLADGATIWLDEFSTLDFDALAFSREDAAPRTALYLAQGSAAVEIPATALGDETTRVDSPAGAIFLSRPGLYRLDVSSSGLHVEAHLGLAELPDGIGSVLLRAGQEAWLTSTGVSDRAPLQASADDFWLWVQGRRTPVGTGRSAQYVDARLSSRAAMLDSYGDWVWVSGFSSYMWRPRVTLSWVPYSYGRWYWTPVGWNWVSYEPWGWVPFHYGSWYWDVTFGWCWTFDPVWSPAWVHWLHFPGYVGWCPRGYYDWWYWEHHGHGGSGHGDHGNGGHGNGGPGRTPARWSEVALRLDGRVHLRDVDPRPWTVVPSDDFGRTRVDRVRVDPGRLLRSENGDGFGVVRSGPLVTDRGVRSAPGRSIESAFVEGPGRREVPDLTRIVGRGDADAPGETGLPSVRPVRTTDVVVTDRPTVRTTPGRISTGSSGDGGEGVVVRSGPGAPPTRGTTPTGRAPVTPPRRTVTGPAGSGAVGRPATDGASGSTSSGQPRTRAVTPPNPPTVRHEGGSSTSQPRSGPSRDPVKVDPPKATTESSSPPPTTAWRRSTREVAPAANAAGDRLLPRDRTASRVVTPRAPTAALRTGSILPPATRQASATSAAPRAGAVAIRSAAPVPRLAASPVVSRSGGPEHRSAPSVSSSARSASPSTSRATASSATTGGTRSGSTSSPSPRAQRH